MKKLNESRAISSLYVICYILVLGTLILMGLDRLNRMIFIDGFILTLGLAVLSIPLALLFLLVALILFIFPVSIYFDWLFEKSDKRKC